MKFSLGHKGCPGKSLSIKGTFPFIKGIKISRQPKGLIFDILGKFLAKISNFITVRFSHFLVHVALEQDPSLSDALIMLIVFQI